MGLWLLIASVYYAQAHKFLDPVASPADSLVADAAEQKLEMGKFFDEVTKETESLKNQLTAERAKSAKLDGEAQKATAELKHTKQVFGEELHVVETRMSAKAKKLQKQKSTKPKRNYAKSGERPKNAKEKNTDCWVKPYLKVRTSY